MFLLIEDISGRFYVINADLIRRIYADEDTHITYIFFSNPRENPSIKVKETVKEFYEKYLLPPIKK